MATEIDDALYIQLPNGEIKHLGITTVATHTTKGLMSSNDKAKLDGITETKISNWDKAHSWGNHASAGYATETWVNQQNFLKSITSKIVTDALGFTPLQNHQSLAGYATQSWVENKGYLTQHQDISGKQDKITTTNKLAYSLISGTPTSLPASDVYAWAKAATKPSYTKSEIGLGNVDNTADSAKNVLSATKLTTARTLWGNSFDGSSDVYGNILVSRSDTSDHSVACTNSNGSISLLTSTNRGVYDNTNSIWLIATNGTNTWLPSGNVGIGTNSPSQKLDVLNGNIQISKNPLDDRYLKFYDGTNAGYVGQDRYGLYLWTTNRNDIRLAPNETEAIRITSDGNVGIGTTAPSNPLTIDSNVAGVIKLKRNPSSGGGAYIHYYHSADNTNFWEVGINTENSFVWYWKGDTAMASLSSNGNFVATGEITAYSDKRLKTNIKDLDFRGALQPKSFIKDGKQSIGFIAQEVREFYPELVHGDETEDSYLSLNYGAITAVLACQTNDHERRIRELEDELERLKSMSVN